MRLSSYWISNFIFDLFKFYILIGTMISVLYIFGYEFYSAIIVTVLLPFGVLPFTYVSSYLFTVDSAAQTFTMFMHFTVILVFSSLIFGLKFAEKLQHIGDMLNWIIRVVPSYSLPIAYYFEVSGEELSKFREMVEGTGGPIDPDPLAWSNNMADIALMGVHFVFWSFLLFLIEMQIGKKLKSCYTSCCMLICCKRMPKSKDMEMDDDV